MNHSDSSPKIAIVHDFFQYVGGAEKVLLEIAHIFPEADLFFLGSKDELVEKYFPERTVKNSFLQKLPGIFSRFGKYFYLKLFPAAVESLDFQKYDLVISTHTFAKGIVVDEHTKHLAYIHSPTRYLWDYKDRYLDEWRFFGPIGRFFAQKKFSKMRTWDHLSAQRPNQIVSNSEIVQKRISRYYNRDSALIYPPVNVEKYSPEKENHGYFLMIGNLAKFKRFDIAVDAFKGREEKLIIAGEGPEGKNLRKNSGENVEFLGFVSDEDLTLYLQNARAIIVTAEEDFGIVSVEAMANGKPVIAYGSGGAREVIEDGKTGILFAEQNSESLRSTVEKFLKREEGFDPTYIASHAGKYSKERFGAMIRKEVNKLQS